MLRTATFALVFGLIHRKKSPPWRGAGVGEKHINHQHAVPITTNDLVPLWRGFGGRGFLVALRKAAFARNDGR